MKAEILIKYACAGCGHIYEQEYDAEKCCPNRANERFICSVCDETFWDDEKAEAHLTVPHGSSIATPDEVYVDLLTEGLPPVEAYHIATHQPTPEEAYIEQARWGK